MPGPRISAINGSDSNSSKAKSKAAGSPHGKLAIPLPANQANASSMRNSASSSAASSMRTSASSSAPADVSASPSQATHATHATHAHDLEPHVADALRAIMEKAAPKGVSFEELNRGRAVSMNEIHNINEYTFTRYYQQHKEVFHNWVITVSRGISGKVKILQYDVKELVRCGGIYTMFLSGTLLTMDRSICFFLAFVVSCFTFVFLIVSGLVADGGFLETESLEKTSFTLSSITPFVLGTYVALALNRWWAIRYNGLGAIFNAIVNLQMVVACVLHPERLRPVRTLIMKWGFASVFLLMKAVRGNSSLTDMLYKCLLSEAELNVLSGIEDLRGRAEVVWAWILRLCHESFHDACGPMPYSMQLNKISELCMAASSGVDVIGMHLDTPLPFVYVHLIALLVDITTMFFVTKSAVFSAVAWKANDYTRVFTELLQCLLVPTLYRGLLSVASQIFDPFGDDVLDYPIGSLLDWTATCCEDVFLAQERFPGVPETVFDGLRARASQKPSSEDPDNFARIRNKVRDAMLRSFRNGRLDCAVIKMQAYMADPATHKLPEAENLNPKSFAAIAAATVFADPIATEIHKFGKTMRGELIVLRHQVNVLHKAVAESAVRQHEEFEQAVVELDQRLDQLNQKLR